MMEKLYIVIPAYNEEANIKKVVKEWYPIVTSIGSDCRLLVIDDGSKDLTFPILKDLSKEYVQLIACTKPNSGHGATILYGYWRALKEGADYVFQTDSDGQTRPEEFWEFWRRREKYDMVIGHRKNREDGLSRIVVTKTLKTVLWLCFRVRLTDANTPFRLMKASTLKDCLAIVPRDFNLSNVLLSVVYAKKKYEVKYLPITFQKRQGGVNSINLKKICKIGRQAWKDFHIINKSLQGKQ